MPRGDLDRNVQESVLDRLIDFEPHSRVEAPPTRAQSVRKLKAAVKRDLEWLLNSRRSIEPVPEAYREVMRSVFVYGLPDLTTFTLNSVQDEKRLLRSLETAIGIFEPRLANVRVSSTEPMVKKAPTLRFLIEGMLMIDPAPEVVSFDTMLDMAKQEYSVKGDGGA